MQRSATLRCQYNWAVEVRWASARAALLAAGGGLVVTAPSSCPSWRRSGYRASGPGRAPSPTASRLTRRTATGCAAVTCAAGGSSKGSRRSPIRNAPVSSAAPPEAGLQVSTASGIRNATSSNVRSTNSSSSESLRRATTSGGTSSTASSPSRRFSSGYPSTVTTLCSSASNLALKNLISSASIAVMLARPDGATKRNLDAP